MTANEVTHKPRILGIGTANPKTAYSQLDILQRFGVDDKRTRSVYLNAHIDQRYLCLPDIDEHGSQVEETQGDLLNKHRIEGIEMGCRALDSCLKQSGHELEDIEYLCCVTSTGYLVPTLSALVIEELGIRRDCTRIDVVGMGCSAGLNGLNATWGWSHAHPGKLAVMICIEVCSAAYVPDKTIRTAVVNSLFGDGAAAVALMAGEETQGPQILKFSSLLVPNSINALGYEWDEKQHKFRFFLDRDVPYIIGSGTERTCDSLLAGTPIRKSDVSHWIIHSGGKKVIDSVRINLGLTSYDMRHTMSVLREFGNLSSGSFLFSFERLLNERSTHPGDYCAMMTMGPGSAIEMALIQL